MKKIKLTTETEVTLDSLTDASIVGFVDRSGRKGYVVWVGIGYIGIGMPIKGLYCNYSYGDKIAKSVKEAVANIGVTCNIGLDEAYLFSTKKELFTWLAED